MHDALGSTTDLTDSSASPTGAYSYDVFGTIRSQSGSSDNYWLFTGEQRDGEPGAPGGVQRLPLDEVVSSTNLTGATVDNLDDDPDDPDGNWATATTVADTSLRVGFPTPPGDPTTGADLQEFRVLLRKDAAGGNDPTYDLELWETGGGSALATLASDVTLSSDTGEVVSVTWDASLLGTSDGSAVELVIVGHRSGGAPSKRRTVEVGAVEWNAQYEGLPPGGLCFLRARYYDPAIGRFLSQDPMTGRPQEPQAINRYPYVLNNPVNLLDPAGTSPGDESGFRVPSLTAGPQLDCGVGSSFSMACYLAWLGAGLQWLHTEYIPWLTEVTCVSSIVGLTTAVAIFYLALSPPPIGFAPFSGNILIAGAAGAIIVYEVWSIRTNCGPQSSPS